nr:transposase, MuDR, MULE transposase domain protein [Tanacetum cinerariifolium]
MVPYEAFTCRCEARDVVLRESYKHETRGKLYYACPRSKEERVRLLVGSHGASTTPIHSPGSSLNPIYSPGSSTPPRYSPGASTPPSYSLGISKNAECSNCKHLLDKKFNLEANAKINFSFKLSLFDFAVDITEDAEEKFFVGDTSNAKPNISKQCTQQSEVEKGNIFDNKEALILDVRTVTRIKTDDKGVFEMLFIVIGDSIRTFLNYLRPMLMIDAAHLEGLYKETNLVAMTMDGNNQIVPIGFGICEGKTGPCWSWWLSVLKECIDDNLNLLFISDRHPAIAMVVENKFPLAFHAICCRHLMQNLSLKNKKKVYSGKYARHTHEKTMQPA